MQHSLFRARTRITYLCRCAGSRATNTCMRSPGSRLTGNPTIYRKPMPYKKPHNLQESYTLQETSQFTGNLYLKNTHTHTHKKKKLQETYTLQETPQLTGNHTPCMTPSPCMISHLTPYRKPQPAPYRKPHTLQETPDSAGNPTLDIIGNSKP